MRILLWVGFLYVAVMLRAGERVLVEFDWRQQKLPDELSLAAPTMVGDRSALVICHTNAAPLTLSLLRVPDPQITSVLYAMVGEIQYENVQGEGYLEMWSSFAPARPGLPEARYFSRTLAVSGEMGKISGTANWRRFVVPFNRTGASHPPTQLEFNLVLPGAGTVFLGPMQLVEYPGDMAVTGLLSRGAWWSEQAAGWIGAIAGVTLGCLASVLSWLAGKGKARGIVLATLAILISLGGLLAIAGLVALLMHQAFAVWFSLLLPAVLFITILPALFSRFRRQYESLELRRMASLDTP